MSKHTAMPSACPRSIRTPRTRKGLLGIFTAVLIAGCGSDPTEPANNPEPSITGISPSSLTAGGDGFALTVSGAGFIEGSTVRWNGVARSTTYISATQLSAAILAGDIADDGNAEVTVSNPAPGGGESQPRTAAIAPAPVASVSLSDTEVVLVPHESVTLEATPRSANGTALSGRTVVWSSSNESVATVNAAGLVQAVALGSALIHATSEGIQGTAQITVEPGGVVGPPGGTVSTADNTVVLEFPAGAVAAALPITIQAEDTPPAHANLIPGTAYDLGPDGSTFAEPVVVRIRFDSAVLPAGVQPSHLVVHRWNGSAWIPLSNTSLDLGGSTVSGTTTSFSPFAIIGIPPVLTSIEAGGNHSCAVVQTGEGYCWGHGGEGAIGNSTFENSLMPALVSGEHELDYITPGFDHNCALRSDNTALCWGAGDSGQIGRGAPGDVSAPQLVLNSPFDQVSSGFDHTCALKENGTAFCWGLGTWGALGTGDPDSELTPTEVAGGHIFQSIDSGGYHTCALKSNGEAWCWGLNEDGQVGDGSFDDRMMPVQVLGGHLFVELAAGGYHTCGRKVDGEVLCWGWNSGGQLGDGNPGSDSSTPVMVNTVHDFTSISAGSQHTCGVAADGAGYCWGAGGAGRLGSGDTAPASTPGPVSGGLEFVRVSAGDWHSCGLTTTGEGYCWGWGPGVGNGSSSTALTPSFVVLPGAASAPAAAPSQSSPAGKTSSEFRGRD